MSDMLSDKFSGLPNATTQYALARDACEGGSDPTELLGGSSAKKWGRSRPIQSFPTVTFPHISFSISCVSKKLLAPQGDEIGDEEGGGCNPYLLHLSFSAFRS